MRTRVVALGVVAVAVAVGILLRCVRYNEFQAQDECFRDIKLIRSRPHKVPTGRAIVASDGDAWPMKLGDLQRTAWSQRVTTRNIRLPRWSFYQPSVTYNTPVVDRFGNIYLLPTSGEIFSLDPNGELRWRDYKLPGLCNPALQDGVLFTSAGGHALALDASTGRQLWSKQVGHRGSAGNEAIAVGEGLTIVHWHMGPPEGWTDEAEFVALNASTGEEVWRSRVDSNYFNVVVAFADEGGSLVFTDMNGGTYKLDRRTGRQLWAVQGYTFPLTPEAQWFDQAKGAPRSHSALALVDQQRGVVYSGGNPTRSTGRVRALSLATGEELWRRDVEWMLGNNGALAEIDGVPMLVFACGTPCLHPIPESSPPLYGSVYAVHAETGEVLWKFDAQPWHYPVAAGTVWNEHCRQLNLPDAFNAPTIDGKGTVFIGWHGGVVYALDGRTGALLSQFDLREGPQAQTAIGPSGELIVIGARWLHSFWPEDG